VLWSPLSNVNPPDAERRSEPNPTDEQNRYLPYRQKTGTGGAAETRLYVSILLRMSY